MIRIAIAALVVAIVAAVFILTNGCAGSDPRAAIYGVQRTACVAQYDAAADVRACVKGIDGAYGQDGGVK